jgi:hypothetical protein
MLLLILGCIGGMIVTMPDSVAVLPFRDRMWSFGLAVLFFVMGVFVVPRQS